MANDVKNRNEFDYNCHDPRDHPLLSSEKFDRTPHYWGHRKRLRLRFLSSQSLMPDYELIEMLLALVQPRKDVKPLAKRLVSLFKSINGIIGAEISQLRSVDGMGDSSISMFKVIHECVCRSLKASIMQQPLMNNGEMVMEYCRASIGYLGKEETRLLFLNSKNYLIADEYKSEGTIDYSYAYPREIITRALELRAKSIIMVHNHPSGDPSPSKSDIEVTLKVRDIAESMEMKLHDHIIVASGGCYSMKANGDV